LCSTDQVIIPLRVALLDPTLDRGDRAWGDCAGSWLPAGLAWLSILAAAGVPHRVVQQPADVEDAGALIVADPATWNGEGGDGRAVLTGAPPAGGPTAALRLLTERMGALVRPDLRGVLLPRIDDPGSSARRHLDSWRHDDVPATTWRALWQALEGFGAASVFCCPGWVEADGSVVDSREASPAEWASLAEGCRRGVAELECHGYTHLHPDTRRWAEAADRFSNVGWYRELHPPVDDIEPSIEAQESILAAWQDACGPGSALVAPGEAWGMNTISAARRRGFQLLSSWGLCRLQLEVPTWTHLVVSPYLDEPDPTPFADDLPVVGYWHDRDMAENGPAWAPAWLEAWRDAGATRAWSFARLARAYATPIDAALVDDEVVIRSAPEDGVIVDR
jgi:hypothetical protein